MEAQLDELIGFLNDPKVEVRQVAMQYVASFTVASAGAMPYFHQKASKVIPTIMPLVKDPSLSVAHDALRALVNLSAEESFRSLMNDDEFLIFTLAVITSKTNPLGDVSCMLLSNLTKEEKMARKLVDVSVATGVSGLTEATRVLDQLTEVFLKGVDKQYNEECTYDYLASVFADVTLLAEGRRYFLTPSPTDDQAPITKLMCFTEHPNVIRRGGVASAMKNCCFEKSDHVLLLEESGLNLLPYFLLPLCGPEEFSDEDMETLPDELQFLPPTKALESDENLLRTHLEALLLLATTREARDILRARNAYRVLQKLHLLKSDDEPTAELIDRIVQLLQGTESGAEIQELGPEESKALENKKEEEEDGIEEI
ncbi:MAG: hypothetical protein DHS80DRAFT_30028 [Piptocephalis tieghemiana]|nr:MAG: hypothetical protein DHS80DRAFT_30028 [Piptocephalis tieghemiana]